MKPHAPGVWCECPQCPHNCHGDVSHSLALLKYRKEVEEEINTTKRKEQFWLKSNAFKWYSFQKDKI